MTNLEPNDPKLVDTDAAYTTIRQAASAAINFSRRLGRTFEKDELVNEGYIHARENLHKYDPSRGPFLPWLYAVCVKHCVRYAIHEATKGWDNGYKKDRPREIPFADWRGPVQDWERYIKDHRPWLQGEVPVGLPEYPRYTPSQRYKWYSRLRKTEILNAKST